MTKLFISLHFLFSKQIIFSHVFSKNHLSPPQDINDTTTKTYVYIQLIGIGQFLL